MDQANAQTEKIANYETSRTRRSIVEGHIHSDDSNNDEEFAASGFYVREKTTEKQTDISKKPNNVECRENGKVVSSKASRTESVDNEDNTDFNKQKGVLEIKTSEEDAENLTKELQKKEKYSPEIGKETEEKLQEIEEKGEHNQEKGKVEDTQEKVGAVQEIVEDIKEKVGETKEKSEVTKKNVEKTQENGENAQNKAEDKHKKNIESEASQKQSNEDDVSSNANSIGSENDKDQKIPLNETSNEESEKTIKIESKSSTENKGEDDTTHSLKKYEDEKERNEEKQDTEAKNKENEESLETNEKSVTEIPFTSSEEDKEKNEDKQDNEAKKKEKEESSDKNDKSVEEISGTSDEGTKADAERDLSILKDQLEKSNAEDDMEMDEDFDPSLLCPDISMDVDESPVITNENHPEDGATSPLPYEATFSTLVDEITGAEVAVDLTPEEMELRHKMYGPNNLVQYTKIHCTACNVHLGSALTGANNRFVHPLLGVLICRNCYHFYTSGEFEKDEDGSELYCRWCGQGGQVLCCSSCEFVFCKRCIRNNFGPRKFKEIRDSDDWNCFRCDRNQLSNLRASCAEFMEYYRTELARAQSLSRTNPELMTTDYTKCCNRSSDKKDESKATASQKTIKKKRKDEDDPDYRPILDEDEEPPKKKFNIGTPSSGAGYTVIPPGSVQTATAKTTTTTARPTFNLVNKNQGQIFKVGNTTFKARSPISGPGYTIQRTPVTKSSTPGFITIPPSSGPKTSTSAGYIKILPRNPTPARPSTSYTVVSGASNGKPVFTTVGKKNAAAAQAPAHSMKHDWFEKTVRAAARVNSNLSYTLTQLNRQQSKADSVEALAMVHNKLQEVLSTSINSLIQTRKNLRTEFISGIKNIKFPPKTVPPAAGPIEVKDDDDVIIVSPPKTNNPLPPLPPLLFTSSVSKKIPIQNTKDPFADPKPSTSGVSKPATSAPMRGGFLKVRSLTALQSVPSECITIPDDPPVVTNDKAADEDTVKLSDDDSPQVVETASSESQASKANPSVVLKSMVYNIKEEPSPAVKKMLDAFVIVKRSRVVDEIIRAQGLLHEAEHKSKEADVEDGDKTEDSDIKEVEEVVEAIESDASRNSGTSK